PAPPAPRAMLPKPSSARRYSPRFARSGPAGATMSSTTASAEREPRARIGLFGLTVGALGVVFGDIGTSPLYAIREAFSPAYGLAPDHATVLGVLSLVFWSLVLVVSIKYVTIVTRADNE